MLQTFVAAGLKLIWVWAKDEENSSMGEMSQLRAKLLRVCQHLNTVGVFSSRNPLEDSGLLRLVKHWAEHGTATKRNHTSNAHQHRKAQVRLLLNQLVCLLNCTS